MTDRDETYDKVVHLIAPFNKKGADLTEATTFAGDLEWTQIVRPYTRQLDQRRKEPLNRAASILDD